MTHSSPTNQPILEIWGGLSLNGEVAISGAKNAALAVMAGSLLCTGECRIRNVPQLVDIAYMGEILSALGVEVKRQDGILDINATHLNGCEPLTALAKRLRASFFILGALLTRLGVAKLPLPSGYAIGAHPIDQYIQGLQAMGAQISIDQGMVYAGVRRGKRLQGARIRLAYPSAGATETLMMAATLADGETVIENAAREPEVVDLANFCRAMGAQIQGAGTSALSISGVPSLHSADYQIIPDRIEAGTFLVAGAITRSAITLTSVNPFHLRAVIAELKTIGIPVVADAADRLRVMPTDTQKATIIKTRPYPGFPTDMQAQFMALLSVVKDNSLITETIFENRLQHVAELNRMGADIRVQENHALIRGVSHLSGTSVAATDLRASAALVLAALAAEGKTTVHYLHHLDRGYDNLEQKLRQLGANLQRVQPTSMLPEASPSLGSPAGGLLTAEIDCFIKAEVA